MWETWVRSLGREDPLEKEMATHSSILAWRIPWTEELDGLQSTGHKELDTTERLHFHFCFLLSHGSSIYLSRIKAMERQENSLLSSSVEFSQCIISKGIAMTLNHILAGLNFLKGSFRSRVGKHILKRPDNEYFRL